MSIKQLDPLIMAHFTGTERWFRHSVVRRVLYTEGVQYVAQTAGAYWLLDEIALAQIGEKTVAAEEFQVWKLVVHDNDTATLICEDGNDNTILSKEITSTDFPAEGITLWFTNNVILLPNEY